jgi:Domain of unknown function (DUF4442)
MADRRALLLRLMSVYPPLAGAGVRVRRIGTDPLAFESSMKLRWWNRNYVGTHFGGSLYTMTDPFFMIILIHELGREFVVWDKSATIRFRRPGRGTVRARFEIAPARLDEIRAQARDQGRAEPVFAVEVVDAAGETVAEVDKTVSVRLRDRDGETPAG